MCIVRMRWGLLAMSMTERSVIACFCYMFNTQMSWYVWLLQTKWQQHDHRPTIALIDDHFIDVAQLHDDHLVLDCVSLRECGGLGARAHSDSDLHGAIQFKDV